MEKIKNRFRRTYYVLREFGLDPLKTVQGIQGIPKYLQDFRKFQKGHKSRVLFAPALRDFRQTSGDSDGHYFWQDLICAQWIAKENPMEHVDVGSRVDGFIAHLLSFMKVVQIDIRPSALDIPGLVTLQTDIQNQSRIEKQYKSVSSLHSIEHFGLGRYGDPIDPNGHLNGLKNIAELTEPFGHLYVSFPIGNSKVEFNSQRVIDPMWPIINLPNFKLEKFVLIPWKGTPIYDTCPENFDKSQYGFAGLYKFARIK